MKSLLFIIAMLIGAPLSASGQVAVIANKSVPVDSLKKSDLINFYTGDIKVWSDHQSVIVFDLKNKNDVKKKFYDFLGKSSSRMKSIWLKKMLSGEGDPPEALSTEDEIVKRVASTAGAIGFVDKAKANQNVKTLMIIE